MTIAVSTRLAIQAASAVLLAVLFSHFFAWAHSYWAILTAMLLISQTWGESIKKAMERVGMTILGGIAGTLIYFAIGKMPLLVFIILLIAAFFIIYFTGKSYLLVVFFTTILVVFLFATLTGWTVAFLEERILETTVGAFIAVLTTTLIFPIRGSQNLQDTLGDLINSISNASELTFSVILHNSGREPLKTSRVNLFQKYFNLQQQARLMSYELMFTFYPRRKLKIIILKLGTLCHYVTNIMEVVAEIPVDAIIELQPELQQAQNITLANLALLQNTISQKEAKNGFHSLDALLNQLEIKTISFIKAKTQDNERFFSYLSLFYYLKKMNEVIEELLETA